MYCLAVVTGINCVINELNIWTEISSEHPIFLKTVAELTDKKLTEELVLGLNDINRRFSVLNRRVRNLYRQNYNFSYYVLPNSKMRVIELCRRFLQLDREAIRLYEELEDVGREDRVWQTLIEHIIQEQKYMYRLFDKLLEQIQGGGC